MLIDGRSLPDGEEIRAAICIVGGGPAGIALALALSDWKGHVCLLESGGFDPEPETQALDQGELAGQSYAPYTLATSRLRYFGGSSNHWEGWCRPLDDTDFQQREWVPHSGWPIDKFQLKSYYERAQDLCELGPYYYSGNAWLAGAGGELALNRLAFDTTVYQFSPPTRFGRVYRERLVKSASVRTVLHANAIELVADPESSEISQVRVATLGGRSFRVSARLFILAAGAVENARLLLASRGRGEAGLGNEHDLVGRYFQEHPQLEAAGFLAATQDDFDEAFYSEQLRQGTRVRGVLQPIASYLRRERLPNFCVGLEPTSERFVGDLGPPVNEVAGAVDEGEAPAGPRNFRLFCRIEQLPNPASRVTLTGEKDALGMPRVRLDWRLQDQDLDNLRRALQGFANEVGAAGVGRVKLRVYEEGLDWARELTPQCHQMGTTRMAADPKQGVVDADCKVHGLDNLYVVGSSVFPTSGFSAPTLTLLALATRLGEHVGELLTRQRRRERKRQD